MSIFRLHRQLSQQRDPSVDLAMAAALPTADPDAQRVLAQMLLDRRHPPAAAALIVHYPLLPGAIRAAIRSGLADLGPILSAAGRLRRSNGPRHVVQLIAETNCRRLATLVTEQLLFGPPDVRPLAADCLLRFAVELTDSSASPAERDAVHAAIDEAVREFRRHHLAPVLVAAAMLLPRYRCPALALKADEPNPAAAALVERLIKRGDDDLAPRLLAMTTLPALTSAATTAAGEAVRQGRAAAVLPLGHYLATGSARRGLARLPGAMPAAPTLEQIAAMPAEAARHLPAWLQAVPLQENHRVQLLAALAKHDDELARLSALRCLIHLHERSKSNADMPGASPVDPGALDALGSAVAGFCLDGNPDVARLAVRHLLGMNGRGLPRVLLRVLTTSPHEDVRRLAAARLGPGLFRWVWNAWPRLPQKKRAAAGRAVMKMNDTFNAEVARRLSSGKPGHRLRAAEIVAQLGLGALHEQALIDAARSSDNRLAATAVKALGGASPGAAASAAVHDVLRACLAHSDARVRANAIESLAARGATTDVERQLRQIAVSDANRPRANAIAELLRERDTQAPAHMNDMLADRREMHRLSALWLVEHAAQVRAASSVAEITVSDPAERVRQKASRTLTQLMRMMRGPVRKTKEASDIETNVIPELPASPASAGAS